MEPLSQRSSSRCRWRPAQADGRRTEARRPRSTRVRPRPAEGRAVSTSVKTRPPGQEDRLLQHEREVVPRAALRAPQRLQGVAAGQRSERPDHGEYDIALNAVGVRAERHDAGPRSRSAPHGRQRRATRASTARWPRRSGSRARPRATRRGPQVGGAGERRRGRQGRRHRHAASTPPIRASTTPATRRSAARRPRVHQQQGHRRQGLQQQGRQGGLRRRGVDGHGTHVAGTVACNAHTPAIVDGVDIPYDTVRASRRGRCSATTTSSRATVGERALRGHPRCARGRVRRRLRRRQHEPRRRRNTACGDLLDNAVDNLDQANMVVAVAAGNEGPGYFTVE